MSARDRLTTARVALTDALARRRNRPHIDKAEAIEIGQETAQAVRAAILFGAQAAVLRADGNLSLDDIERLAPLAKALGVEAADVVALVDEGLQD